MKKKNCGSKLFLDVISTSCDLNPQHHHSQLYTDLISGITTEHDQFYFSYFGQFVHQNQTQSDDLLLSKFLNVV